VVTDNRWVIPACYYERCNRPDDCLAQRRCLDPLPDDEVDWRGRAHRRTLDSGI
jgi:hypothetical protein